MASSARVPADATPAPPEVLQLTLAELAPGQVLHRIHQNIYNADQFNPGVLGNARFSPIRNALGEAIPTLYAGTTFDCAVMETVFHDVPHSAGNASVG